MDNRVYGLMEAAEAQQQAVERAIEALKTTRQEIQAALIQGAAQGTKAALNEATAPINDNLKQAAQAANQASKDLSDKAARLHWKWSWHLVLGTFGTVAAIMLSAWLISFFQRQEVERLNAEKASLEMDVSRLQANVAELEKKGGRIVLNSCGVSRAQARLCIEVEKKDIWADEDGKNFVIPKGY